MDLCKQFLKRNVRKVFLLFYHSVQYVMTFLVLMIILHRIVQFLNTGDGLLVLAGISFFVTIKYYTPGDCPWWWVIVKEKANRQGEKV